jgi:hypothetical protein
VVTDHSNQDEDTTTMKKRKNDRNNGKNNRDRQKSDIERLLEAEVDKTQWLETRALVQEVRGALSDAMDMRGTRLAELILDIGMLDQHGLACSRCLGRELEELACRAATLATKVGGLAAASESTGEDQKAAPLLAAASELVKAMDVFGALAMQWLRPDVVAACDDADDDERASA